MNRSLLTTSAPLDETSPPSPDETRAIWSRLDRDLAALKRNVHETFGRIIDTMAAIERASCGPNFSRLEAEQNVSETTLPSKLRDGAMTLKPEWTRSLLAKVDVVRSILRKSPETTFELSPARRPVARTVVAGRPDHAVVAPAPEAILTPSATSI